MASTGGQRPSVKNGKNYRRASMHSEQLSRHTEGGITLGDAAFHQGDYRARWTSTNADFSRSGMVGGSAGKRTAPHVIAAMLGVAVLMIALIVFGLTHCSGCSGERGGSSPAATEAAPDETRVHFVAVGDNIPEDELAWYANGLAGDYDDGDYDFEPIYAPIKSYIQSADVAYVKEETHLGGDDIGPKGYPSFNTVDAMADCLVNVGFDLVASASNHSYDWGYFGAVDHSCAVWKTKPVVFTGTAANEEDAAKIATLECKGITFALLDYTYGVNGYDRGDFPDYYVNWVDEDRIRADVARAKEMADVVMVAMHWGTENYLGIDDYQAYYADLLTELEVDVVLGSHPHVIGGMDWTTASSGHKTLMLYSLGNFLSYHMYPEIENQLEGMMTCDFVKNTDGSVAIENVTWVPLVNHREEDAYAVYALKDYTQELADRDECLGELDDPIAQMRQITRDTIGDDFPIDDGSDDGDDEQ